jgi:hypothetical protein
MPEVKAFDEVVPKEQVPKPEYDMETTPKVEPDIDVKTSKEPDDMPDVAPAPKRIEPVPPTAMEPEHMTQDDDSKESFREPDMDEPTPDEHPEGTIEPVVEATMEDPEEEVVLQSKDDIAASSMDEESTTPQEDIPQPVDEIKNPPHDPTPTEEGWVWVDVDPATNQDDSDAETVALVQEEPAVTHVVQEVVESEDWVPTKDKVDLQSFFEAPKEQRKWKRSEKKQYSKKERKRRKQRSTVRTVDAIEDQRTFLFRKKKYKEVDEFIAYLNDHYLDIDDVAQDVLANEWFFGWLAKRSGVLPQSLNQFKELKRRIEKNQRTE